MRLRVLLRLLVTLLLIFVTQKVVFMLFNLSMAAGAPFGSCVAALWHGLRLDVATACYLLLLPVLVLFVSYFFRRFPLRKVLMPYYVLVAIVLAFIFVADTILYSFWGAKLDANDLIYAAKPKDMLASLPVWAIILAFLVVGGIIVHYCRRLLHATPQRLASPRRVWHCLWLLPVVALMFLGMRGGLSESTANPSYAYFSKYPFCNHAALNPTFNMFHSLFKVQDLDSEFNIVPDDEAETMVAPAFEPDTTLDTVLLNNPRPDILLVIWEGAGLGVVGSDSVAPCLHSLIPQGVYFSNCWANSYRTDRGLISVLSGWLGLPTTTLMKRPDLCRNLPSIASSLKAEGYATKLVYGGDIDFTNMRMYFSETGFSSVLGGDAFPKSMYTSAWGVPDEHLLRPDLMPSERPFFSTVLTLSSHEPWEVPMQRLADARLNSFAYTDSCLGALIDGLKASPVWDSLLVIVVPDHGIIFADGMNTANIAIPHIPMLWLGGALAHTGVVVDRLMSQSDLAATLLAQMHLSAADFPFSRNVLGSGYPARKQFAVHSDKNRLNYITPEGAYFYDCVTRNVTPLLDAPADSVEARRTDIEALLRVLYSKSSKLSGR